LTAPTRTARVNKVEKHNQKKKKNAKIPNRTTPLCVQRLVDGKKEQKGRRRPTGYSTFSFASNNNNRKHKVYPQAVQLYKTWYYKVEIT
jgi:hypothetical protein